MEDIGIQILGEDESYIGYDFERELKLYMCKINILAYSQVRDYSIIIQGKNSNGNWVDISDEKIVTAKSEVSEYIYYINDNNKYSAFRIKNNELNPEEQRYWHIYGTYALLIKELQFYCIE